MIFKRFPQLQNPIFLCLHISCFILYKGKENFGVPLSNLNVKTQNLQTQAGVKIKKAIRLISKIYYLI